MYRVIFSTACALFTIAAPAFAQKHSFTQDGITYVYTDSVKGDARILEGTTSDGSSFRFVVRDQHVTGDIDDKHVSFDAPRSSAPEKVARR